MHWWEKQKGKRIVVYSIAVNCMSWTGGRWKLLNIEEIGKDNINWKLDRKGHVR